MRRDFWLRLHLYLGLSAGLLLAWICLTGSLAIYRHGIEKLFNPSLYAVEAATPKDSLEPFMAAVRAAHPERQGAWTLELPEADDEPIVAWHRPALASRGGDQSPLLVYLDPRDASVIGNRLYGESAGTGLFELHVSMGLGRWGEWLLGGFGLVLVIAVVSGVYLWVPDRAQWRKAFVVEHRGGARQLALDLHRLVGFFSAGVLLVIALSGLHLAYPKALETLVGSPGMGHGDTGKDLRSSATPGQRSVNIDEAVLLARGPFAKARLRRVTTPVGPDGAYHIVLRQSWETNLEHPATQVWIDQFSGQIRDVANPAGMTPRQRWVSALNTWHSGEALGAWGAWFWFLSGLAPTVLLATGTLRWLIRTGRMQDFAVDLEGLSGRLHSVAALAAVNALGLLRRAWAAISASEAGKRLKSWAKKSAGN